MGGGTAVDLEAWADTYGLNSPVASDFPGSRREWCAIPPTQQLIGRGGEVLKTGQAHISDADIELHSASKPARR